MKEWQKTGQHLADAGRNWNWPSSLWGSCPQPPAWLEPAAASGYGGTVWRWRTEVPLRASQPPAEGFAASWELCCFREPSEQDKERQQKQWNEREEGVFETCYMLFIYAVSVWTVKMYVMLRMYDQGYLERASNNTQNETDGSLNNSFCNLRVLGAFSCS